MFTRSTSSIRTLFFLASCTLFTATAATAHAQPAVHAQVDVGAFTDKESYDKTSAAMGGSVLGGYVLPLSKRWFITPELGVGFLKVDDAYGRNLLRGQGGARLGWLASPRLVPTLSAHAGYGRAWGVDEDAVLRRGGLTVDTGGGLDFIVAKGVAIGPHASFGAMFASTGSGTDVTSWIVGGLHLSLTFDSAPTGTAAREDAMLEKARRRVLRPSPHQSPE